jgi:hypothetical protein
MFTSEWRYALPYVPIFLNLTNKWLGFLDLVATNVYSIIVMTVYLDLNLIMAENDKKMARVVMTAKLLLIHTLSD